MPTPTTDPAISEHRRRNTYSWVAIVMSVIGVSSIALGAIAYVAASVGKARGESKSRVAYIMSIVSMVIGGAFDAYLLVGIFTHH